MEKDPSTSPTYPSLAKAVLVVATLICVAGLVMWCATGVLLLWSVGHDLLTRRTPLVINDVQSGWISTVAFCIGLCLMFLLGAALLLWNLVRIWRGWRRVLRPGAREA
jgi:hypothetical protein